MSKLNIQIKPHALNKKGNPDYCIISLCLEIDRMKFYDNHALYSSYILDQKEYSEDLLKQVGNKLKENFIKRFDIDDQLEDMIDYKNILDEMKSIRKETLDSTKN